MTDTADNSVKSRLQVWLIQLFIRAINGIGKEEDRADLLAWLERARDIVAGDATFREKFVELHASMDTGRTIKAVFDGVVESVKNYRDADLPWAVKLAVPVTLLAVPFAGGHGVGLAAFGGAVGMPALLLIFLGSAGITSIIEAFVTHPASRAGLNGVVGLIVRDEVARRVGAALEKIMEEEARRPAVVDMPDDERAIREALLEMDPYLFEGHVMSFFEGGEYEAVQVTPKSTDLGVDGWARRADGAVSIVQCKRYASTNPVGRPDVQRFKGVIEEQGAERGYIVTTSRFTKQALESASQSPHLTLVDMDGLIGWHRQRPEL